MENVNIYHYSFSFIIVAEEKSIDEEEQNLPTTSVGSYNVNEALDTGVGHYRRMQVLENVIVAKEKSINDEEQDLPTTPIGSYNVGGTLDTGVGQY